ncbi:MAG: hypothetical protein KGJ62_13565 [Armatimonadetes bacterium]|nr:hypothetical protein [Armatimonadota bacterium]MDE2206206.1 hypothetical protein [Armatimonadota bacterium]
MITLVSISYAADPVGNRAGETVGSTSTSFTMDNDDELASTSGGFANSYSYNANGEQTGRTLAGTAYTLAFDYDGQLKSITQGTAVTSFGYDALGRRVSRTASGTTTSTQYAGGAPVTETQGSSFTAAYTVGNDLLRRNGEYPAFDGLGSARAETNSSGTATATQDFDAFGNTIASSGSTSSPYNFAGDWAYQSNGDAGLQHVGARYYDPQVGRFASRDSMLDQIPYAYCWGEPNDWADPSGANRISWGGVNNVELPFFGTVVGGAIGRIVGGLIGQKIPYFGRLWRRFTPRAVPDPVAPESPPPADEVVGELGPDLGEGGEVIAGGLAGAEDGGEAGLVLGPEGAAAGIVIGGAIGLAAAWLAQQ